ISPAADGYFFRGLAADLIARAAVAASVALRKPKTAENLRPTVSAIKNEMFTPALATARAMSAPSPARSSPSTSRQEIFDAASPALLAAAIVFFPDTGNTSIAARRESPIE